MEEFLLCCARALQLFDGPTFLVERRKLLQIEADGLLAVDDFARARTCCAEAVAAGGNSPRSDFDHFRSARADMGIARLTGLLAFCCAKVGDLSAAIDALDRGKALLWDRGEHVNASHRAGDLIPPQGALLFPLFASEEGIVLIATRVDGGPNFSLISLPRFGKTRMLELLRGPSAAELGGWLYAYCYLNSEPARLRCEIETLGQILYEEFWQLFSRS